MQKEAATSKRISTWVRLRSARGFRVFSFSGFIVLRERIAVDA